MPPAQDQTPEPALRPRPDLPYLRIAILLCPGFTLTPMASFVDALRLAADREDMSRQIYFAWDFIAAGAAPIRASCGLDMAPTGTMADEAYDCVVVCGGVLRDLPQVLPDTFDYLRRSAARGIPVIGLCTGSFVLAEAGLLDRRRCALHFDVLGEFLRRFPNSRAVTTENHVIDDNIITCPGSIVAIEVATHLIARYGDSGRAQKALNYLLFKPGESRIALKARPYEEALAKASRLTSEAVQTMEMRLDSPCSIDVLARALNTSRARLNRAFARDLGAAPADFWRRIRLHAARELLSGRRRTVTEVAYDTGFCDTAHFCAAFRRHFGLTPQEFRRMVQDSRTADRAARQA